MPSQQVMRWGAISVAAAAAITILASTAISGGADAPVSLEVVLTDASTRKGADCAADAYTGSFFDGTEVELADGNGSVLATSALSDDVRPTARGCAWSVALEEIPATESYTLTLRSADSDAREHTYSYSAKELADRESLWIAVFR